MENKLPPPQAPAATHPLPSYSVNPNGAFAPGAPLNVAHQEKAEVAEPKLQGEYLSAVLSSTDLNTTDLGLGLEKLREDGKTWEIKKAASRNALYAALPPAYTFYLRMKAAEGTSEEAIIKAALTQAVKPYIGNAEVKPLIAIATCILGDDTYSKVKLVASALAAAFRGEKGWGDAVPEGEKLNPVPAHLLVSWLKSKKGLADAAAGPTKKPSVDKRVVEAIVSGFSSRAAFGSVPLPADKHAEFDFTKDQNVIVMATLGTDMNLHLKEVVKAAPCFRSAATAFVKSITVRDHAGTVHVIANV